MTTVAFGLDLAGYSTGKSGLVRACKQGDGSVDLTVFSSHALSEKRKGTAYLGSIQDQEIELILSILKHGSLIVDVPIDLQGLPFVDAPVFVWQLTKRAVDQAFNGFPPFADRMGSYVVRFHHIIKRLMLDNPNIIGTKIFETYPSATLDLTGILPKGGSEGYKGGRAYFDKENKRWLPYKTEDKDKAKKYMSLANLINQVGIVATDNTVMDDDIFDATICALTGIADKDCVMASDRLTAYIGDRLKKTVTDCIDVASPAGYVLLQDAKLEACIKLTTVNDTTSLTEANR